jgi:tripartite-type tricarboxylate transporter receptor subunit TctC
MTMKTCMTASLALALSSVLFPSAGEAAWPCSVTRVIVASSAGGGTDVFARAFGAMAEKELGTKIVVSNNASALGMAAAQDVWAAPRDGCTIMSASESSMAFAANGAPQTAKDWHYHIFGGSPGVIAVRPDSPYKTFESFMEAAKASPGKIKLANSGAGKLWHIKAKMIEVESGVEFKHAGYNGSKPAMVALLTGEVDAVSASVGEIAPYVESGKMVPLVITEAAGFAFKGGSQIKPVTTYYPSTAKHLPNGQFLAYEFPRDTPQALLDAFRPVFDKVVRSPEFAKFLDSQGATLLGLHGKAADDMVRSAEQKTSWFMQDQGLAKVNPETIGILRP